VASARARRDVGSPSNVPSLSRSRGGRTDRAIERARRRDSA
jgi:hypothetical protein